MSNRFLTSFVLLASVIALPSCAQKIDRDLPPPKYKPLRAKQLAEWRQGTIFERVEVLGTQSYRVGGFGLVVNLRNTGNNAGVPLTVREYFLNELGRGGFGTSSVEELQQFTPERVLNDNRTAIVRVDMFVPPGARAGQRVDVQVSALETTDTESLAGGRLYLTDLVEFGGSARNPDPGPDIRARAQGNIVVNPAYAMLIKPENVAQKQSLRYGLIPDGGKVAQDRVITLRVLQPSRAMTRAIEQRIDQQFDDTGVAAAIDEGIVRIKVPDQYGQDWEHFLGVVTNLYRNGSGEFLAVKARELAELAVTPDAPLREISWAWEGMKQHALPFIVPLMTHSDPAVAFAATRAAAFIGEPTAPRVLQYMAQDGNNPFRVEAVRVLGALQATSAVRQNIRPLLNSTDAEVRTLAYRTLAGMQDASVTGRGIADKFFLDLVPSAAAPTIFATRTGTPRLALIGNASDFRIRTPVTYTTMEDMFMISDDPSRFGIVTLFYRGFGVKDPLKVQSTEDLVMLITRLASKPALKDPMLDFGYDQVISVLQDLSDRGMIVAGKDNVPVSFVLEQLPMEENRPLDARPGTDAPVDAPADGKSLEEEFAPIEAE